MPTFQNRANDYFTGMGATSSAPVMKANDRDKISETLMRTPLLAEFDMPVIGMGSAVQVREQVRRIQNAPTILSIPKPVTEVDTDSILPVPKRPFVDEYAKEMPIETAPSYVSPYSGPELNVLDKPKKSEGLDKKKVMIWAGVALVVIIIAVVIIKKSKK